MLCAVFVVKYKEMILEPDESKENITKLFSFSSFLLPVITSILGTYLYDIF
jgi:hypothetical protein